MKDLIEELEKYLKALNVTQLYTDPGHRDAKNWLAEVTALLQTSGRYSYKRFRELAQHLYPSVPLEVRKHAAEQLDVYIRQILNQYKREWERSQRDTIAATVLEGYRREALDVIVNSFPSLKDSFEIIDKHIHSNNRRERDNVAVECRHIFVMLSDYLWQSPRKEYKLEGDSIQLGREKNNLLAYVDTKIEGPSQLKTGKKKKLYGMIHEVFTIGGKSKRGLQESELSTAVANTFGFLTELVNYTDLQPVEGK